MSCGIVEYVEFGWIEAGPTVARSHCTLFSFLLWKMRLPSGDEPTSLTTTVLGAFVVRRGLEELTTTHQNGST
jgi:hypothetical protein